MSRGRPGQTSGKLIDTMVFEYQGVQTDGAVEIHESSLPNKTVKPLALAMGI